MLVTVPGIQEGEVVSAVKRSGIVRESPGDSENVEQTTFPPCCVQNPRGLLCTNVMPEGMASVT